MSSDGIESELSRAEAFHRAGNVAAAEEAYRALLQGGNRWVGDAGGAGAARAHLGLAFLLNARNQLAAAEQHFRNAATGDQTALAQGELASNLLDQGRPEEACDALRSALDADNTLPALQHNRLLFSLYDPRLSAAARTEMHRQWGKAFDARPSIPRRAAAGRIRVGYVSADFKNHPVSFFVEPLLRHHDRVRVELFCYSDVATPDSVTARLQAHVEHWVETRGLSDEELADRIARDGIDVLVDLAGHSAENRLALFGRGVAPVQVSTIGYPATTGLAGMYRFSDPLLDPAGAEGLYTETTLRLPAFWCYEPPAGVDAVTPLPASRGNGFTFGSSNYLGKINAGVIETWARILLGTPRSRLVLKAKSFDDPVVRERVRAAFVARGVEGGRLELHGSTPFSQYLADFGRIDLCLDPFPFNGGTTTFHSFYMGVPIVALEGSGHAERMGAALLRHVGLADFVARDRDEYVQIAVRAAHDLPRLAGIRAGLRQRLERSPLMDGAGQARAVEKCYRQMLGLPEPLVELITPARESRVERTLLGEKQETPAISVIACGRDAEKRGRLTDQVRQRMGECGAELLYVENPPSLAAGYNAAMKEAQAEILLFIHDDVDLLSVDFAPRLRKHLATYDVVGVAGTSRLIDGAWGHAGQPYLFGQVAHPQPAAEGGGYALCAFGGVGAIFGNIQGLDGLLIAARREAAREIGFDEATFDGFHLYDLDFSFRAHLAGRRVAVANDLFVLHHSWGAFGDAWRMYHDRFVNKFAGQLAAPPAKASHWFSKYPCRTEAELLARMRRNALVGGGFTY